MTLEMTAEITPSELYGDTGTDNLVLPFQINPFELRGRVVRLGSVAGDIIGRHDYPDAVAGLLGETMALAGCLSSALKFEGIFTLQTKGDGAIKTLMADITSDGDLRGYASYDEALLNSASEEDLANRSVKALLGEGYIAFTVDQGTHTERYQGIVALEGDTLADCARAYFRESEQIDAGILISSNKTDGTWRAGGMMIQRTPYEGGEDRPKSETPEDFEESWRRAMVLMSSCTDEELMDPALTPDQLLFRLFHEDGVRAYPAKPVQDQCRCSEQKVVNALLSIDRAELEDLKIDGELIVECEFCKTERRFDDTKLDQLAAKDQG